MSDKDPGDPVRGDPGEQHLPLRPLPWVEQQPLLIPQQQVAVVITAATWFQVGPDASLG